MARYDDLNTNMIAYAALISCLLLVAILQGTQALCYSMTNAETERKLNNSEYTSASEVISEQHKSISGYQKVALPPEVGPDGKPVSGETKTRLQIPIDRAIELLLNESKTTKPATPGA